MESLLPMIINLVSGAVGGNAAGGLLKKFSLGPLWNSVVGILGGGIGGQVLGMLGMGGGGGMDLTGILSSVAAGGAGGGVLLGVVGMIKKAMGK